MHLRMPSIDQGVQAGIWAVFFFFVLWVGMLALGISRPTAFILSLVAAGAIFLFVRIRGEDRPGTRG
jgi:protein-S-isoprenylcysteine O-methyltransferase Ste14